MAAGHEGQRHGADHTGQAVQLRRRVPMAAPRPPTVHLSLVCRAGGQAPRSGPTARQGLAHGADVWPQVTPRPLTMQFTLADPYSLNTGTVFGELLKGDRPARIAAYRDPAWRARAAADLEQARCGRGGPPSKSPNRSVSRPRGSPRDRPRRVKGRSPLDVMCDLSVAEDLKTRFRAYIANDDSEAVGSLLDPRPRRARALRRRRSRRSALRRAGAHRPARHLGSGTQRHAA